MAGPGGLALIGVRLFPQEPSLEKPEALDERIVEHAVDAECSD
jgi:hypothetical protein